MAPLASVEPFAATIASAARPGASAGKRRQSTSNAVPQSNGSVTVLTQLAGAFACMVGIILGLMAYAHWPGNFEAFFNGGWVLNPLPYFGVMAFSVCVSVCGLMGAIRPESTAGRVLVWVPATFGVVALVVLVLAILTRAQAPAPMRVSKRMEANAATSA